MTNFPLAYLITWHTKGSWLHGDRRGSVDRLHNQFGEPLVATSFVRRRAARDRMKHPRVKLDAARRRAIRETIVDVACHRGWDLLAVHVRTNHVHIVIAAEQTPERVMNDMKAWSTRRMIETGVLQQGVRPWARHGSTRYLWNERSVAAACGYVRDRQGVALDD
ncbi:MAG: hypothetical protein GXP26_04420 [Planctomycetes bacterium]|nr:hypothetical protein [Planctomycetota bacterium]